MDCKGMVQFFFSTWHLASGVAMNVWFYSRRMIHPPPPGHPNSFDFMQILGKFGKQIKFFFTIETEYLLVVLWWYLWIMYENFRVKENIWCDILGFDQSEQMNIKLMLHSVWKFWQIAMNSIAKKSLIWSYVGAPLGSWRPLPGEILYPPLQLS